MFISRWWRDDAEYNPYNSSGYDWVKERETAKERGKRKERTSFIILGTKCKSKAKVAHINAFQYLVDNYGGSTLRNLVSDQSADGAADAEKILRPKWPNYIMNYDLWHKVYPFVPLWKKWVYTRTKARGPLKYPKLKVSTKGERNFYFYFLILNRSFSNQIYFQAIYSRDGGFIVVSLLTGVRNYLVRHG